MNILSGNAEDVSANTRAIEAKFTRLTATRPRVVSKVFSLVNGQLHKETSANVYEGRVEIFTVADLSDFAKVLLDLSPAQCLIYGLPHGDKLELVTEEVWAKNGRPSHQTARTKNAFHWSAGPGVLMLDYDPPTGVEALARDKLIETIRRVCPALCGVEILWWPSASSNIVNTDNEEELRGVRGQRLYLMVQDSRDIERASKALLERLWAAGYGHFEVSKSGSLLERGLFDASVWQPNRIDFAGGAKCNSPLEQCRGAPVLIAGDSISVDSASAISDLDAEALQTAASNKSRQRQLKQVEAVGVSDLWKAQRVDEMARLLVTKTGVSAQQAKELANNHVDRALGQFELCGDWLLSVVSWDSNKPVNVSVAELLDAPYRWHGCQTLDPIEPEYDGGRCVGKLYLIGARPALHSFAHGGRTFRLMRQLHRVEIVQGRMVDTVDGLLDVLRQSPDVYDYGSAMAIPAGGGKMQTVGRDTVGYTVARVTQFWKKHKAVKDGFVDVLADPPKDVTATVLALEGGRNLRPLDAVLSAPLMRLDGSILNRPGYDAGTRLLLDMEETPQDIPANPTPQQIRAAFDRLWEPFRLFPFVGPVDRAVLLAALLTAIERPVLEKSPAIAFDAAQHGSGKSALAECVSVMATGEKAIPWSDVKGEEEIRKRIMTMLRGGHRVLLWDNVMGTLNSASLAALLTAERYNDRILGVSLSEAYPNRVLTMFTGNNFTPSGELPRRVLTCRLDAQMERPYQRKFDFYPTDVVLANRQAMVAAGLTLLAGFVAAGKPELVPEPLGTFEQWDGLIRQCVLWVGYQIDQSGFLGDPVQSTLARALSDPMEEAHASLLWALIEVFQDNKTFTAREVASKCSDVMQGLGSSVTGGRRLVEAFCGVVVGGRVNSQSIGNMFGYRLGHVVQGMCLAKKPEKRDGSSVWWVKCMND